MENLPSFEELAENQLKYAGPRDKTINMKIAINTARMMVNQEKETRAEAEKLRVVIKWLRTNHPEVASQWDSTRLFKSIYG